MEKHTREPWSTSANIPGEIFAEDRHATALAKCDYGVTPPYRTTPDETDEANARRIVAAVNACAGVSTEALEGGIIERLKGAAQTVHVLAIQYGAAASEKAMAELLKQLDSGE
jgi:hypothetical protein